MSHRSNVLVVGAGIAGLAAAGALHDLGWEVDLVERKPSFEAVPTGLFFPANGVRALRALGAANRLLARGRAVERLRAAGADGGSEAVADMARIWPGVGPALAIHRALAQEALLEWCRVAVRTGTAVRSLTVSGHRVGAALSDGSAAEYDLVVAADGVYSTVRRQLWPDRSPRYGGESWWRGVVACPAGLEDWSVRFCRTGTFLALPIGGGLAYWAAGSYSDEPFDDPVSGRAARVRDRFRDVTGSHLEVLEQVFDDACVQFSPADEVWVEDPVWGRVVLIGDACHATTPSMAQGGSMAAEDALVLARELAGARGHGIDVALERYAARRQPRTRHVQETTAMRNRLAALPLEERIGFVVPAWEQLSVRSFAPLLGEP